MGQQLLISIYIVSGIRSNSDDLKYLGSYMELIYQNYAILYKGLERPGILL